MDADLIKDCGSIAEDEKPPLHLFSSEKELP